MIALRLKKVGSGMPFQPEVVGFSVLFTLWFKLVVIRFSRVAAIDYLRYYLDLKVEATAHDALATSLSWKGYSSASMPGLRKMVLKTH